MGASSSKKKKRRAEEAAAAPAAEAPALEALEELAPAPYVPPRPITLAFVALTLAGVAYFASEGVQAARSSDGRVAGQLLRVEPRNERPPAFKLKDYDGKEVSLDAFKDKVVFLNFWATWCPPCVEEMPSMRRLQARMADDPNFVMLAVSTDDDWDVVRKFFEGEAPPFPVLLDPGGTVAKEYGTVKFPETYILKDGKVVGFIMAGRDWDPWYAEAYLRGLLKS
ncbi:MAG: TlpA family protein disulfide reductase [Myxococcales bacterium]|nr:TlpA family protein disulfide reductase [Myxococcales bacterium]MCB9647636.1 TlpA family protein disulfide reductase [Deltaproteobacteria bacterium]